MVALVGGRKWSHVPDRVWKCCFVQLFALSLKLILAVPNNWIFISVSYMSVKNSSYVIAYAIWYHWSLSSLLQLVAGHLFDVKPHPKTIIIETYGNYSCPEMHFNSLRPRRNRQHFTDDILTLIFFNEYFWISSKIELKFVSKDPINNNPALAQIMAWHNPSNKPLSEPVMVS